MGVTGEVEDRWTGEEFLQTSYPGKEKKKEGGNIKRHVELREDKQQHGVVKGGKKSKMNEKLCRRSGGKT